MNNEELLLKFENMQFVYLKDLINKDVKGVWACVDSHLDGVRSSAMLGDRPMIRELISVEMVKKRGQDWIYWMWVPNPQENGFRAGRDCGYSGISLSFYNEHPYQIKIERGKIEGIDPEA